MQGMSRKGEFTIQDFSYLEFLLTPFEKLFERSLNDHSDPVVRYSLFVELTRMGLDTLLSGTQISIKHELARMHSIKGELSEEEMLKKKLHEEQLLDIKARLEKITKHADLYFTKFSDWIRQPTYSPDHPFGHNVMKEAELDHAQLQK